jgi:hypothetical protein
MGMIGLSSAMALTKALRFEAAPLSPVIRRPLLSELDPPRPELTQHHGHCLGFELYGTVEEDLV